MLSRAWRSIRCLSDVIWQLPLRCDYGAPVTRNRLYIILVRKSLLVPDAKRNFQDFATGVADKLKHQSPISWILGCRPSHSRNHLRTDLLFPRCHQAVQEDIKKRVKSTRLWSYARLRECSLEFLCA